ncbi:MAG TPA: hypothetical protein VM243_19480 [Phycisphaerae bacterium]|nr:hypothetical protein [Phycisphaerae bacterium]
MQPDPVVEELRDHGARIAEHCGGDVHRMAEHFRHEQAAHPQRVTRRPTPDEKRGPERAER